jgi:myo-inositol-1(or 4)-monophosphatase
MKKMMELEKMTAAVCNIARETGLFLKQEAPALRAGDVELKGLHNFVTYVDKESEKRIISKLTQLLPGSGFIAEETPGLMPGKYTWVIDPLDGTTNFIHGVPLYCISIALMQEEESLLGVVYEVNLDECFYTWKAAPAFLNGQPIRVSKTLSVFDSLLATGFPYFDYGHLDEYLDLFRYLMQNSRGVRRLGSAAADLAYVSCGRFDGFYEYGLSPWDVAAGALIVKNAGGIVTDFRGEQNYIFGKEIVAVNSEIFPEFIKLFEKWETGHSGKSFNK